MSIQGNASPQPVGEFSRQFERVFCISLPRSIDRRNYISSYFDEIGISSYEYFDATDSSDEIVSSYYNNGLVASYPPCFRCKKATCGRDDCNNVLIPSQVATFITYLRLWEEIVSSGIGTALIVEDDVRFSDYAPSIADPFVRQDILAKIGFAAQQPMLLRLGWALSDDHHVLHNFSLSGGVIKMSNPCHAINNSFAKLLLSRFKKIDTTVDIYQHMVVGSSVANFTLFPPLAYELSWSVGALDSLIHPKPIRTLYLEKHHPKEESLITKSRQALLNHVSHILYRPLLVVGHPRCGSGYMSQLLQALGLEVGHEKMGRHGISSWMFAVCDDEVPFAQDKYSTSRKLTHFVYRIHHVRDPRNAVPSIMRDNKYSSKSLQYRRKHIKNTFGIDLEDCSSEIERAILSYVYWNRIIEESGVDIVIRVEDQQEKLISMLVDKGVLGQEPGEINWPSAGYNSNKPYHGIIYEKPILTEKDWKNVQRKTLDMLNTQCEKYGYEEFDTSA